MDLKQSLEITLAANDGIAQKWRFMVSVTPENVVNLIRVAIAARDVAHATYATREHSMRALQRALHELETA